MTDIETWRPVVGWEGLYQVSDQGRVRGRRGNIRIPRLNRDGYLRVNLSGSGNRATYCVHRLVCDAFLGPLPEGMETLHGPGGHVDNSVANLSYGTHQRNTQQRGNPRPKLTATDVRTIRTLHANGQSYAALARRYGVSGTGIKSAVTGRTWRQVAGLERSSRVLRAIYRDGNSND